jgi:excisionase family DNA binding protein
MTLTEAAERLGVAPSTLRVQLWKGKLRGTKRGRDWWITPAEVDRYAAESGRKVRRCTSRYPGSPRQVRCEDTAGHSGEHHHSFYARYWEDDPIATMIERDGHPPAYTAEELLEDA